MNDAEPADILVSLVIPAHNAWDLTEACLNSVRVYTRVPHEIILVDDASEPGTAERMREAAGPGVTVLRNEERRSFSANNNRAAAVARGKYLCLLNNDTVVTPGWLEPLVRVAEGDPTVAVVGNKHLFPKSGLLHHCGIGFDRKGHPYHLHPHTEHGAPAVNYQRELQAVTFACALIPRTVYTALGGLDERYRTSYEDCDFCLRAREAGLRVVYTPASTIYHHGQASPGRSQHDADNWGVFRERWQGRVTADLEDLTRRDQEYNRSWKRRPRLRPESEEGIHFAVDVSQGSAFVWAAAELISALDAAGERVSILPAPRVHHGVGKINARLLNGLMKRRPCRSMHVKFSHYWPAHMLLPLAGEVNAEFFVTNYGFPAGVKALDPWMRNVQLNDYRKLPVSAFNLGVLAAIGIPADRCAVVPLGHAPEAVTLFPHGRTEREGCGELQILVVTNSHDLRRYGTDVLVSALGEAYGFEDPVVVHIKDYGEGAPNGELRRWIAAQRHFPRVVWHNKFLTKADLMRLYAKMDLLVAPFRGEGFGMKIIDAMALGVPALMPAFGGPVDFAPEGTFIPVDFSIVGVGDCLDRRESFIGEQAFWCEPRREHLVEQLRSLPARRAELRETGRRACEHVRAQFSWQDAARRLVEALWVWKQSRLTAVGSRRGPSERPLSVVIPTKNRPEALAKALEGYRTQDVPPESFEIIVVNDHGDREPVAALAEAHSPALRISVLDNVGRPGPAAARNLAVENARGDIVLFVGDDIIPAGNLLGAHIEGHRRHRELEGAVLGRTLWHREVVETPFLRHICGAGGQQFDYRGARDGGVVPMERFYTSNVSVKRDFLIEEEQLFSERFPLAAYEDVELAFRLHLRGLRLRYAEDAVAYHLHPTSPASFLVRQGAVGRMLTVLTAVQPAYVPEGHKSFLRALEAARCGGLLLRASAEECRAVDSLVQGLLACYQGVLAAGEDLDGGGDGICDRSVRDLRTWFEGRGHVVWDALNELALRRGMAEEWARDNADGEAARWWATLVSLPAVLKAAEVPSGLQWVEERREGGAGLLRRSPFLLGAARWARFNPWLEPLVRAVKKTRVGTEVLAKIGRSAGG